MIKSYVLDIDYIFKWELEEAKDLYAFWVSPCLLVFHNVLDLKIEFDFQNVVGLDIDNIKRLNPKTSLAGNIIIWKYVIETNIGIISFYSTRFSQKVISQPVFSRSQLLPRGNSSAI